MPRYPLGQLTNVLKDHLCYYKDSTGVNQKNGHGYDVYYEPGFGDSISILAWIGQGENVYKTILVNVYSNCDYKFTHLINVNKQLTLEEKYLFQANQHLSYLLQRTFAMMF